MNRCLKSGVVMLAAATAAACFIGAQQAAAQSVDPANVAFGYVDSTGTMLLSLNEDNRPITVERAASLVDAVCSDGQVFPILYVVYQQSTPANNFRDLAGNLANSEGQLFEIVNGGARPDAACLLVPAGFLAEFPLVANALPPDERDVPGSESIRQRLAAARDRLVEQVGVLHRSGDGREVAAVYFSPIEADLLGAIVLAAAGSLYIHDMPATLDEYTCWSVDDGCRFRIEAMHVPAVLESAGGDTLVYFTFDGYENQSLVLFAARDGELVELRRSGRYWAPL